MSHETGSIGRLHAVSRLSDAELTARLSALVDRDRHLTAELLVHIGEVDARRLYARQATSSLFQYCVTVLGFSEDVAYKRVAAARMARRYPWVLELVENGKLHLSGLLLVAPHLTPAGHRELLAAACGKSKREVEKLVAERFPRPDVPTMVRKLPERGALASMTTRPVADTGPVVAAVEVAGPGAGTAARADTTAADAAGVGEVAGGAAAAAADAEAAARTADDPGTAAGTGATAWVGGASETQGQTAASGGSPAPRTATETSVDRTSVVPAREVMAAQRVLQDRARVEPLAPARYRVTFTAGEAFREKLEHAQALASHAVAPSDVVGLLERALDAFICQEENRRFAVNSRARVARGTTECARATKPAPSPRSEPSPRREPSAGQDPGRVGEVDVAARAPSESPAHCEVSGVQTARSSEPSASSGPCAAAAAAPRASRYHPARVRRSVWERDGGCCTFVDETGRRCTERRFLELEHLFPHALGGLATEDNTVLLCKTHNALAARVVFGDRYVDDAIARKKQLKDRDRW